MKFTRKDNMKVHQRNGACDRLLARVSEKAKKLEAVVASEEKQKAKQVEISKELAVEKSATKKMRTRKSKKTKVDNNAENV